MSEYFEKLAKKKAEKIFKHQLVYTKYRDIAKRNSLLLCEEGLKTDNVEFWKRVEYYVEKITV